MLRILLLAISSLFLLASNIAQTIRSANVTIMDLETNPGEYIETLPLPPPKEKGSIYYDETFWPGDILLDNERLIKKLQLRCDLQNNLLEVILEDERVLQIEMSKIKEYTQSVPGLSSKRYITGYEVDLLEIGSYEVLLDQENSLLLKQSYIDVKHPNYNPALNIGSPDIQYLQKERVFFISNNTLQEPKRNIKSISNTLNVSNKEVKKFLKNNDLDLKKDSDLIRVFGEFIKG